jgi:hypothetical protein
VKNTRTLYATHPAILYSQKILENLPEKTGRPVDEWVELLRKSGLEGEKERSKWLKTEHGLGGTTAALIANVAAESSPENYDESSYLDAAVRYVEDMYADRKAHLRPIHDALLELALELGDDVRISPCKTIVPIYRNHVIAQIAPSTLKLVDLGLALKGTTASFSDRLLSTGGLERGDRITHRFRLADPGEIDADVKRWLRIAYELDA